MSLTTGMLDRAALSSILLDAGTAVQRVQRTVGEHPHDRGAREAVRVETGDEDGSGGTNRERRHLAELSGNRRSR